MSTQSRTQLLQGTLDMLILSTLASGRAHGQGVARAIQARSRDSILVEHGSLYPALQRLEERGWIRAEWGTSENNRRARFYELTATGRRQLVRETREWWALIDAIALILGPQPSGT
jgi:transcriptional regulator